MTPSPRLQSARKPARTGRFALRTSDAESETLQARAKAHGLTVTAYIRLCTLSGGSNRTGSDADGWWDQLTPARRDQVYRWLNPSGGAPVEIPGQASLTDDLAGADA